MISLPAQGAQSIIALYDKLRVNTTLLTPLPSSFSFHALLNANPFPGARLAANPAPRSRGKALPTFPL